MANSINTITISGNMGKDPEIKHFQSGTKKATFSVAISEGVKVNNQWETKTTGVLVEFWGNDAEYISSYGAKGAFIVFTGKLAEDTWEKDGKKFSKLSMVVEDFQFLDKKEKNNE